MIRLADRVGLDEGGTVPLIHTAMMNSFVSSLVNGVIVDSTTI